MSGHPGASPEVQGTTALDAAAQEHFASIGFTGTREGLTQLQHSALVAWFSARPRGILHHGDCVGADASVHETALYHGWRIEAHPGLVGRRAYSMGCAKVHPPRPNLDRNSDIVEASEELLACPLDAEKLRSGTWATVRRARRRKMKITIFWPNGSVTVEPASAERSDAAPLPGTNP